MAYDQNLADAERELRAAGAERDRYRAAWQSARRRAREQRETSTATVCLCPYEWYPNCPEHGDYRQATDPGCPYCGDLHDPDQPNLHARCRRIPDAEARRDGRDG